MEETTQYVIASILVSLVMLAVSASGTFLQSGPDAKMASMLYDVASIYGKIIFQANPVLVQYAPPGFQADTYDNSMNYEGNTVQSITMTPVSRAVTNSRGAGLVNYMQWTLTYLDKGGISHQVSYDSVADNMNTQSLSLAASHGSEVIIPVPSSGAIQDCSQYPNSICSGKVILSNYARTAQKNPLQAVINNIILQEQSGSNTPNSQCSKLSDGSTECWYKMNLDPGYRISGSGSNVCLQNVFIPTKVPDGCYGDGTNYSQYYDGNTLKYWNWNFAGYTNIRINTGTQEFISCCGINTQLTSACYNLNNKNGDGSCGCHGSLSGTMTCNPPGLMYGETNNTDIALKIYEITQDKGCDPYNAKNKGTVNCPIKNKYLPIPNYDACINFNNMVNTKISDISTNLNSFTENYAVYSVSKTDSPHTVYYSTEQCYNLKNINSNYDFSIFSNGYGSPMFPDGIVTRPTTSSESQQTPTAINTSLFYIIKSKGQSMTIEFSHSPDYYYNDPAAYKSCNDLNYNEISSVSDYYDSNHYSIDTTNAGSYNCEPVTKTTLSQNNIFVPISNCAYSKGYACVVTVSAKSNLVYN